MSPPSVFPDVERILDRATHEARKLRARAVEPLHLFVAVCKAEPPTLVEACKREQIDLVALRRFARGFAQQQVIEPGELARVSQRVRSVLQWAKRRADGQLRPIAAIDVVLGLLERPDAALQHYFTLQQLPLDRLRRALEKEELPAAPAPAKPLVMALDNTLPISRDLTALAKAGRLGPLVGRDDELRQLTRILLRRDKSSALLIGEPGVGKTALVEALAQRAAAKDAPPEIASWHIVELSMPELVAEARYRSDLDARLRALLEGPNADPNLILFIDELHALVDRKNGSLANLLKPALTRTALRLIGATTPREHDEHIDKDPALARRFLPVRLAEPSVPETRAILLALRPVLEQHHQVVIDNEAIAAAVDLSVRHLPARHLPDKARDVLDQAAANQRFRSFSPSETTPEPGTDEKRPQVGRDDVAAVIADWAQIPLDKLSDDGARRLLELEAQLEKRVIGQHAAVSKVARVVRTGLAGLARSGRPYGVFLFVGPTGVGKTELAKALAESLFGSDRALLRFDMSEYHDEHTVQRLIGAPPGYVGYDEGGQLTNALRKTPHAILLFDEIEKAHAKVADLFLQIFDDGRITDGHGRVVDCSHTVVVVTSNLITGQKAKRAIGFGKSTAELSRDELLGKLRSWFRLELLNRFSEIVQFEPLAPEHIRAIID